MSVVGTVAAGRDAKTALSPAIQTRELAKQYGRINALAGLSMTVPRGEVFGFLGPNGAGKTTAVKLLLGLVRPTSGDANVLGAPVGDRATRRQIGYLPELFRYQGWLSAREVLALHCELAGIPRDRTEREVRDSLDTVGLSARADDRVETFSKGMQQRLGLGVALLGNPELIFLDEPTSALDPVGRHDVRDIIRRVKDRGATVFLNSHLLSEVELLCDRVAIVNFGRVIAIGAVSELLGETSQVRLRVDRLGPRGDAVLADYGTIERQGEWCIVRGVAEGAVPDLIAAIVREGGRVFAVEPAQQTLEDRFLQILGGENR
jgi:ABC-2 type transport system ATP-binding protein